MSAIVFSGPTLAPAEVAAVLAAEVRPPAMQGDVYRAALQGPPAIGLVDGCLETMPAVWHNEILWAMAQGIHVFGAAGVGALRAVELAPFGMDGVGAVFEAFRDGLLEDDAEVAVRHGGADAGYAALSVALVDVRATAAGAAVEGVLAAGEAEMLVRGAAAVFYKERTWPRLLDEAAGAGLPPQALQRLRGWLPAGRVARKRLDALDMLRTMRSRLEGGLARKRPAWQFRPTRAWMTASRLAAAEGAAAAMQRVDDPA